MHALSHLSSVMFKYPARYAALKWSACALSLVSGACLAGEASPPEAIVVASHSKLIHAQPGIGQTLGVTALQGKPSTLLPPLPAVDKIRPGPARSKLPASPVTPQLNDFGSMTFNLSTSDQYISNALRRFASAHGWKLSWEVDRDFDVQYDATFSGSFLEIVEQIAGALQNVNTPIRVKAYHGNHVLRVLYATY